MPGTEAIVEWRMTQNVNAVIRRLRNQAQNPRPAYEQMLDFIAERQVAWFEDEGSGHGRTGWKPLNPKYQKWKWSQPNSAGRKKLHGPDIEAAAPRLKSDGTMTKGRGAHTGGQLKRELTQRPFGVENIRPTGFTFGTNIDYAQVHAEGSEKIPRRQPIAPMGRSAMVKFEQILLDHLATEKAAAAASQRGKKKSGGSSPISKNATRGRRK